MLEMIFSWKLVFGIFFLFMWFGYGEIMNMMSCFPLSFEEKREYGKPCLAIGSALLISHFEIGFTGKFIIGIAFLTCWFLYGEHKKYHRPLSFWEKRTEGLSILTVGGTALALCIKIPLCQMMLQGLPYFLMSIIYIVMLIIGISLACEFIEDKLKLNRYDTRTNGAVHCSLGSVLCFIGTAPLLFLI